MNDQIKYTIIGLIGIYLIAVGISALVTTSTTTSVDPTPSPKVIPTPRPTPVSTPTQKPHIDPMTVLSRFDYNDDRSLDVDELAKLKDIYFMGGLTSTQESAYIEIIGRQPREAPKPTVYRTPAPAPTPRSTPIPTVYHTPTVVIVRSHASTHQNGDGANVIAGIGETVRCGNGCNIDTAYNCDITCGDGCNIDCGDECVVVCGVGCNIKHGERCDIKHGKGCNVWLAYPD